MEETAQHLIATVQQALALLQEISDSEASVKPAQGKWSHKEIIGHLVDSANNNVQKFVRTILHDGVHMPPYEQDSWVSSQHYNEEYWKQLLSIWEYNNYHIAHIMQHVPASVYGHKIFIGGKGPYTLEFIVKDYNEHLKHHLKQVLPDHPFLANNFEMMY